MSRLDRHVAAVQRKLSFGMLVESLCWAGLALAVGALVLVLAKKTLQVGMPPIAMWIGVILALGGAALWTLLRLPTRPQAAVAIDEKLGLKEKFSTALHVRPSEDPFAQAVVRDAEATAERVNLAGQFPMNRPRAAAPAAVVACLAVGACFLPPMDLLGKDAQVARKAEEQRKVEQNEQAMKAIKDALVKVQSAPPGLAINEQIKLAKDHLESLIKHPTADPAKAQRSAMAALQAMQDAMKQEAKKVQATADAKANERMFSSLTPPTDEKGPVSDAQRALAKGDFDGAMKEMEKAVENFNKMPPEEQKKAAQQMAAMAQQLQQLANNPQTQQQMQKQMQQMGASPQQAQQMTQLMQQAANGNQQAQQQLAQAAQQMMNQMNNGQGATQQQQQQISQMMQQMQAQANSQGLAQQMAQASQAMAKAMQQGGQQGQQGMNSAQQTMQDAMSQMQAMQNDAQQVAAMQQAVKDAMQQCAACNGQGQGQNNGQGQPKWSDATGKWGAGDPQGKQGQGQGGPGIGAGGRMGEQMAPFTTKQEHSKSQDDPKGKILAASYVKDENVKGEAKIPLQDVVAAAQAEQSDEVDDTRIDGKSAEVVRNYFRTVEERQQQQAAEQK